MTHFLRLSAVLLGIAAFPAYAQDWQITKGSSLSFSSSVQGEAFTGSFTRFSPQIRFDPRHLGQARFDVTIDLTSATTRNDERDDTLKSADFFNVRNNPNARYTASTFTDLGKGRYQAKGLLNLRGISRPVTLLFHWQPGTNTVLRGEATVNRLDYQVGGGDWADTGILPNAVKIKTVLLLAPKPTAKP